MREILNLTAILAGIVLSITGIAKAEDAVRLQETFSEGWQYSVRCQVELNGTLSIPGEKEKSRSLSLPVKGKSILEYDERILAVNKAGQVD